MGARLQSPEAAPSLDMGTVASLFRPGVYGHLLHVIRDGVLAKTLPSQISVGDRAGLRGARITGTPLPAPAPGPVSVRCKLRRDGIIMITASGSASAPHGLRPYTSYGSRCSSAIRRPSAPDFPRIGCCGGQRSQAGRSYYGGMDSSVQGSKRVQHVRVADTIAADLRARILAGEFNGSFLPSQHELVAQHGAGLVSVREAMRILEAEGLITIRRGNMGGAEVHAPDLDSAAFSLGLALQTKGATVDELGEALLQFEPVCIRLCAASDGRADIAEQLETINDDTLAAIDDGLAFAEHSRRFHAAVVSLCGNKVISHVIQSIEGLWALQVNEWARHEIPDDGTPDSRRQVISAHRRIVLRIASGDGEGAERAARIHLEAVERGVLARSPSLLIDVTRAGR
jgi:GntR family transcriptional regulator, transcriptional repressor for pyruvate dehydrogenase complex